MQYVIRTTRQQTNGLAQVAFSVYSDFMTYKSGVYHKAWWHLIPEGGHAVRLSFRPVPAYAGSH